MIARVMARSATRVGAPLARFSTYEFDALVAHERWPVTKRNTATSLRLDGLKKRGVLSFFHVYAALKKTAVNLSSRVISGTVPLSRRAVRDERLLEASCASRVLLERGARSLGLNRTRSRVI